jgi:hypothetical protein
MSMPKNKPRASLEATPSQRLRRSGSFDERVWDALADLSGALTSDRNAAPKLGKAA